MQMFTTMWAWVTAWSHETSHKVTRNERGATATEWVLIVAGAAALAIAVVAIIGNAIKGKANEIPLN